MKFAHMADCHIGGWRDPKLRDISTEAFSKAIDLCIEEQIDFLLISGDLFNTSLPGVERLQKVTQKLKQLHDKDIPCYIIAGSHDFSPSGKTMLDVLESAGLCINVARGKEVNGKLELKFTQDLKTKIKITGIIGKKGGLDKHFYSKLNKEKLEQEHGEKIFMFHSSITELKPTHLKEMDSDPVSVLPRGFDYYAGGHVHIVERYSDKDYPNVVYPGPIFPNNFTELEKLHHGGFYIVEDWKLHYIPLEIYPTRHIILNVDGKTAHEANELLEKEIQKKNFDNMIITLCMSGMLRTGKPNDIDFKKIFAQCYAQGAYFVMKNIYKLESKEFEEVYINTNSVHDIEEALIDEHASQQDMFNSTEHKKMVKQLMHVFIDEKNEGERIVDFEKRLFEGANTTLKRKS